jgi:hypothetical protein
MLQQSLWGCKMKSADQGANSGDSIPQLTNGRAKDTYSHAVARIARVVFPDFPYHVAQRGVRRWMFSSPLMTEKNTLICYLKRLPNTRLVSWHGV